MAASVKIRSLDDLLVQMGSVEEGLSSWDDVDLKTLKVVIPVKVDGLLWDKRIDVRGAEFIKDLQKKVASAYSEVEGERLPRSVLVKADVKEGSNWLGIDYTEIIKIAMQSMTPDQIFYFLCFAVLCPIAAYSVVKIYMRKKDSDDDDRTKELAEKAIEAVRQNASEAIQAGGYPTQPIDRYVRRMKSDDSISIANSPLMTKKEALSKIQRPKRDDVIMFTHSDGTYALLGIELDKELPVLRVEQDGIKEKAFFNKRVPERVKNKIIQAVDESIESGEVVSMSLRANTFFTQKKREYIVVLGTGKPRPDLKHYALEDIPDEVNSADAKIAGLDEQ